MFPPGHLPHRMMKRGIDTAGALLGLAIFGVPMALIGLAILLTDHHAPVLFRQQRCGQGGRPFRVLKFRTMVAGADAQKETLRASSTVAWPDFRLPDDPRVTRLGRFLRKTSLDELPQLINVLLGDMSMVGPRPTSFAASTYDLWQTERLAFRPGLTGPWQVWGRTSLDFPDRCRLEIAFFRRRSLLGELSILLATVPVVLRRTGVA